MAKSYKKKQNKFTKKFIGGCEGTCPVLKGGARKRKMGSKKKKRR